MSQRTWTGSVEGDPRHVFKPVPGTTVVGGDAVSLAGAHEARAAQLSALLVKRYERPNGEDGVAMLGV